MEGEINYDQFIEGKIELAIESGFDAVNIHPSLKPHQRDTVRWAVKGGKRALFSLFGLGKTIMQCECLRQVHMYTSQPVLQICPLGVKQEFFRDGKELLGIDFQYVRTQEEVENATSPYLITNYERVRDGNINVNYFSGVSLDEASVLRGYGTKTFQEFLKIFPDVKYKFVATATPSPNKFKELIHYAGFLGIMDTGQALTRFFKRDSQKANNLNLMPSMEKEFWLWMCSWATFLTAPSDLGYSDKGYDLPGLEVRWHRLKTDHSDAGADSWGQFKLIKDQAVGLVDASREKRESVEIRLKKALEIIDESPNDNFLLWHHQERERLAIEKEFFDPLKRQIGQLRTVFGNQDMDLKEKNIIDFSEGEYRILATKPIIAGSGCNFQGYCHRAVFMGINYKFNDFIQAIHRLLRFAQKFKVIIDVIYLDTEDKIKDSIITKWAQHNKLQENMKKIIKEHGLSDNIKTTLTRSIGVDREVAKGKGWELVRNDTVIETSNMETESVDLIHTSIPFSNHYEYSPAYECFGHNKDDDAFFSQMDYLTAQLYRVLKPGRIAAIHVKNRIMFGNVTGYGMPTLNPFSHKTVFHYMKHGFRFMGEIPILTDVVRENNQTYRLGWSENAKDSTKMGVGCPEYVLLFRKPQTDTSKGYADVPVTKDKELYGRAPWQIDANGFWRSKGDRFLMPEELLGYDMEKIKFLWTTYNKSHVYDYDEHVKIGEALEKLGRLPASFMLFPPQSWRADIWDDVTRMHTLNSEQSKKSLDNHICPLQFDIVDRTIKRFSNEGELVFDPFVGIGTVAYRAVKLKRRGRGHELNRVYWEDGTSYLRAAEYEMNVPTLFNIEDY